MLQREGREPRQPTAATLRTGLDRRHLKPQTNPDFSVLICGSDQFHGGFYTLTSASCQRTTASPWSRPDVTRPEPPRLSFLCFGRVWQLFLWGGRGHAPRNAIIISTGC